MCFCFSSGIMDTRQQSKIIYSWYGKPTNSDRKLRTLQYKGILIKSERSRKERCIQLGDFVLVEGENADQPFVAQLLDLYEDGAEQKHAVVQWFSHISEIPKNKQKLLKRRISSQEVFFDKVSGYDTDIAVETIIDSVLVIPLRLKDELPTRLKKEKIFCVKQSWDGKCFKALSPHTFSKLNEANRKEDGIPNSFNSFVPSDIISSAKKETKKAGSSATKTKNVEMEIESKHSASKSSLSKKRHSLRVANGIKNPTARKKLELNSPTRSPKSKLLEQEDIWALLDDDCDSQLLKPTAIKRKVKFTEVLSSPPKITCANDKLKSVFGTAEDQEVLSGTLRLSPYRKLEDSNEKVRSLNMEVDAIVLTGHKELGSQSPAVTPRSRRTCTQETSTRIAEQISLLNMLESKEEEDFLSSSDGSYSSSSEEEDSDVSCTPEKKTKPSRMFSTPKSSRKPSVHTPAKTPKKTPLPGTPRTPRNATPEIPRRSHAAQKPTSVLEEARLRLHVSAVPESLPCREEEFQDIYNFVESKLIDGTGGCMYISGVPGTGKTATVHEVIRCLQRATEDDDLPSFQFIEINGMKLTDPHQAYVQILELLTGQKVTATHAAVLLANLFCTPGPKRKTTVLVVDELDLLWTRKQNVMYNLFDWPTQKHSKLIILAIANTMDLPERIMMNRVSSRLGLTRMSFQPYTYKQLQQIISSRLNSVKAFEEDAIQLVSRKVAALSGDARRCLDICRRAAEICEFSSQKSTDEIVRMTHITQAIDEMFSSPYIQAIRNASLHEQIFFKAILAEFRRVGVEEATVQQVYRQHIALCRMEGMQSPTVSDILAICARLGACRLLLLESSSKYLHMRVRLNISQDDVMYALKDD
ncbi:origin recognition complex subunit 1 isoform X1 [Gallus gallus]|nr:origin recognition complex subunit 1 isoform X1 [Gallus gallus]XP_040560612.1 origin recognition complex subunit 1 isoform X1 [Gallus gallus]XP_046800465.1 origin recognition complex subunit 1 isoform X1 [Gallus gallus]XP_046800466.1 origin recognition complex subunit 1 isoform X1 [Gallus gallus]